MKNMFQASFALLQKIGKSMMLPVSVLPVAGILLGVGSAHFGFLPPAVSQIMAQAGGAVFGSLPLLFAIAVAVGLTENDGVAAMAATVGFVVLLATMGVMAELMGHETKEIMGMKSIETGVFGGILIGGIAAYIFKKYYRIQLPTYLAFFGGKRFVPIATALAAIALAMVMSVIWPHVQGVITAVSHEAAYKSPTYAAALYGFVERLLVPFGLHHIWNVPFFFEIGDFTDKTGKIVHGDVTRFFAGDPTAGILGGAYLFKMWGLPAAAIAIWHCAKPENKAKVGSIMVSAALTSFLTGITEPVEFAFLFVAPLLYFVHAVLAGVGQFIFGVLGAKLGFTFSQGFIDFVLYYSLDTKPYLVLIVGPLFGLLYYGVFRAMILGLNLKTPGRESEVEASDVADQGSSPSQSRAIALVQSMGGRSNIKSLDACITRLRVELHDVKKLDSERLKSMGASGVVVVGSGVQAIFGPQSENYKSDMEEVLKQNHPALEGGTGVGEGATARVAAAAGASTATAHVRVEDCVKALGGRANIVSSAAVAETRLRVELKDSSAINEGALKSAGVQAVIKFPNQTLHLVVGVGASQFKLV